MEEFDPATAEAKPLIGWSLKAGPGDALVLYLEFSEASDATGSLTLAVPPEAVLHLAGEMSRWIARAVPSS